MKDKMVGYRAFSGDTLNENHLEDILGGLKMKIYRINASLKSRF